MQGEDAQLGVMRLYRSLTDQSEDWGGKLVLVCGSEGAQTGAPAAVSIAGGTTLVIDPDPAMTKAAQRAGYLDFVVNSLDEALRALKNEVRQRRSLSVGLIGNVDEALAEIEERGVEPDLRLDAAALLQDCEAYADERLFAAGDTTALREVDLALMVVLPGDDAVRRRWIQRAPQFLREARSGGRWIWLGEQERVALAAHGITPVQLP